MTKKLSTDPYKGTRDFYPEDMAIQRYIFDTWAKTAESFGYERYDASILEPSELYKSKGAENEEMVNEQTYTFIDRGEREVTLRPEMTPTVARMVAARRRDLTFPVRWYSIPNLFRYERPQRGRLREHWQLNCDIFGADDVSADFEMIALAYNVLKAFGAKDADFEIKVNDRAYLNEQFKMFSFTDEEIHKVITLLDRKDKIDNFDIELKKITEKSFIIPNEAPKGTHAYKVITALDNLGIKNVKFNPTIVRGFDYYTGTVFEIFDTSKENNRSLIGGGRYDNLTSLFGGDPISGVGFGMGDVTMRDFLETHKLLPKNIHVTAPTVIIIPSDTTQNIEAQKIAQQFRNAGIRTAVDISTRKADKKKSAATKAGAEYILTFTEKAGMYTLRTLTTKTPDITGSVTELVTKISAQ